MKRRVVVTGGGGVSALGSCWSSIRKSLLAYKNTIVHMDQWEKYSDLRTRLAAPVHDFSLPKHFKKKLTRGMGRVAQLAVVATEYALNDAQLLNDPVLKSGNAGVAYGSAGGSSDAALEFFHLLQNQSTDKINGTTYVRMMSHSAAVNISVCFGTRGRLYTTSSACTAGSQGIGFAYEVIRNGQQDLMIAGGSEELCPTQAAVFDAVFSASTKNSAPTSNPRPFDRGRDGLVIGEGAGTLILESLDHALARGANILAEVVGFATNTDGAHLTRPKVGTMEEVMRRCLQDAGVDPVQVGYISGHGTGTLHGDIAESQATAAVFANAAAFGSLKSYIGHSLGACAALEAWLSIMMMTEGWFAPNLNLDNVDPRCGVLDYIRGEARQRYTDYVMSNNFAFGGVNTSLLFKRYV